ncbi:carbon-nitrogen hydrolase family protein, partial [Candidatus Poribacteria bacterium]|nr:carbon-nitrogen hydrolase family protein [Candidatus Poribacteria bacterium]
GCGTEMWLATAEPVPGPTYERLAERARRHNCHIVCPIVRQDGPRTYNSAILIGRDGGVIGVYDKMHPTVSELSVGITPGASADVFETDFGRVGFAICFDLNFRDVVDDLARGGAELVCFASMYRGGLQTRIWAFDHAVYFASATPDEGSVIVDPLGNVLEQSDRYEPIISRRVNLDYADMHIDENHRQCDAIKAKYGDAVELDILSPEARFILYSHHAELSVKDIIAEFSLETTSEYFARSNRGREEALRAASP